MVNAAETISLREARVDAMLRVLPEAVFEIDREGRFVDVHGGEIELVAPREQLIGARYTEALVAFPQLVEALDDLLGRAFDSDQISSVEYSLKLADGEHVYEARAVATSERAIVTVNDVTDMRRLLAHLVIADRQRAAAALAGSLLHEIATPISYILTSLDTLCLRLDEKSEASELATTAREGARQLAEIARDFRMLARSDDSSADSDVTDTLQRVLRFAEGGLSGAVVSIDGHSGVRARIPEARLGQVLVNLLANASFAVTDLQGAKIGLRVFEEGARVVVEITDNGVGIAPENMARIFDPFFTTRPDGVGTGLGLWLVRRILDAHGATIVCESRSGEGTTFRVSIPGVTVD